MSTRTIQVTDIETADQFFALPSESILRDADCPHSADRYIVAGDPFWDATKNKLVRTLKNLPSGFSHEATFTPGRWEHIVEKHVTVCQVDSREKPAAIIVNRPDTNHDRYSAIDHLFENLMEKLVEFKRRDLHATHVGERAKVNLAIVNLAQAHHWFVRDADIDQTP